MSPLPAALALSLFAVVAAAQDPSPPKGPVPATTLLARLKVKDLSPEVGRQIWQELTDRPVAVRGQALEQLRKNYLAAVKSIDADRQHFAKLVRKAVPEVQRNLLGKHGSIEVDKLRGEALAVTRRADLEKKHIKEEIDPRRARLEELLLPNREAVFQYDIHIGKAFDAANARVQDARAWYDLYLGGIHTLDEVPGGRRIVDGIKQEAEPLPSDTIDADFEMLLVAALPMSGRDAKALEGNSQLRGEMEPEEYRGTLLLNRIRYALGLPLLAIDPKLTLAARDHSQDMLRLGFFSHTSPVEGKTSPGQRAARFGTSGGAENIAAGQASGEGAISAWWYSPGHHKNMLGGHGRTGLGRAEALWTQMFGG
ncbi:MAG: hypothetical protein RL398_630 [Planctomycetota bacterium]